MVDERHFIDCGCCGAGITTNRPDGFWEEDAEITCEECKTVNVIGLDDDEDDEGCCSVYVRHWRCSHGKDSETPCDACALEQGVHHGG